MKKMMQGIAVAAAVCVLAVPAAAQGKADPEAQKLADAFVQAWNKGDAKALAALHAENAIRAGADGQVVAGRAAIEKSFTEAFAGPLKGSRLTVTTDDDRSITADVRVSTGTWTVSGGTPVAGAPTKGRYINALVRQGGRYLLANSTAFAPPQ